MKTSQKRRIIISKMFINVIFPVFVVVFISYIFSRFRKVSVSTLSSIAIYLLTPALIIRSFDIHGEIILKDIHLFLVHLGIYAVAMYVISLVISKVFRMSKKTKYAFILLSLVPNTGNIGIPVCEYYLGSEGGSIATFILVITSIMTQTYGVYLASRGVSIGKDNFDEIKTALKNVFSLPLVYVVILSITLNLFSIKLPTFLRDPIYSLGFAAIPMGLVQLGIVLGEVKFSRIPLVFIVLTILVKLIIAPLISGLIGFFIGFSSVALKVLMLQYGMPSALYCSILATHFNLRPKLVGITILIVTTVSILTLTGMIYVLSFL